MRITIATIIKSPNPRVTYMFAEEYRRDDRGPYAQAWTVPPEQARALHVHSEVYILIPDEQGEFCKVIGEESVFLEWVRKMRAELAHIAHGKVLEDAAAKETNPHRKTDIENCSLRIRELLR